MKKNFEFLIGYYTVYSNKNISILNAIEVIAKAKEKSKYNTIFQYKKQKYIVTTTKKKDLKLIKEKEAKKRAQITYLKTKKAQAKYLERKKINLRTRLYIEQQRKKYNNWQRFWNYCKLLFN